MDGGLGHTPVDGQWGAAHVRLGVCVMVMVMVRVRV